MKKLLFFFALLLSASKAGATACPTGTASGFTISCTKTFTAGHTAIVGAFTYGGTVITVSDSLSLSFSQTVQNGASLAGDATIRTITQWCAPTGSGGSDTLTVSGPSGQTTAVQILVLDYAGITSCTPNNTHSATGNPNSTVGSGNMTTTATSVITSLAEMGCLSFPTVSGGFTIETSDTTWQPSTQSVTLADQGITGAAAGTYASSYTCSGGSYWLISVAAYPYTTPTGGGREIRVTQDAALRHGDQPLRRRFPFLALSSRLFILRRRRGRESV